MANHALLDNITHKDLRIITDKSSRYTDATICAGVFPIELRQVQSEYPIIFRQRAESEHYEPVALFGLSKDENLFLSEAGWQAGYVPLSVEREPFLIGLQAAADGTEEAVMHVDMDSPRISESEGQAVFLEHGGSSPYLEHINSVLFSIHEGHQANTAFSEALMKYSLLEPFSVEITLNDKSRLALSGFQTVSEEGLKNLGEAELFDLHQAGYLENIYMALASMTNFRKLIAMKNALI